MRGRRFLIGTVLVLGAVAAWTFLALLDTGGNAASEEARREARASRLPRAELDDSNPDRGDELDGANGVVPDLGQLARSAEIVLTDADTLRAVRGRVVDARTRQPVPGLALSFLSRRPRTIAAVTDADGRFQTAAELAPGAVSVQHAPAPIDVRYAARWEIEPAQFLLPPRVAAPKGPGASSAPKDEPCEVVLLAHEPERVLEATIRMPDGTPAEGAAVSLTWGERSANGEFVPLGRDFEESDLDGRARFALFGPEVYGHSLRLEAEHKGTLASEILSIDPPIPARSIALALHPGGVVRVRATNDEGRPIAGVSLYLSVHEDAGAARGWHGDTEANGEALFTALRAGCYTVSAVHPLTGERLERTFDLARSAQVVVDFKLSLAGLRLALQGSVLDEYGYPLPGVELRLTHANGEGATLASGEKGQFEFWCRPEQELLLAVGRGIDDDRFDPSESVVPFGTRGLVVRRAEAFELRTLAFELVDAESGAPIRGARLSIHQREGGTPVETGKSIDANELATFEAPSGVLQATFKLRPGLAFVAEARDHARTTGTVAELYRRDPSRVYARIALERGFERTIVVRDRVSRRPLAGVRVRSGQRELATSDAQGRIELSLPEWPASLTIECTGYRALAWDPADAWFPDDAVGLDPLR